MEHILPRKNVHASEQSRWLYGIGGGALLLLGLRRRSLLGTALSLVGADMINWGVTGHFLHEALGLTRLTPKPPQAKFPNQLAIKVEHAVTINRPAHEVYAFFRDLRNLSRCMQHVNDIRVMDDTHSHWFVKGPAGTEIEWDAAIFNDLPGELIAWRSINHPPVESTGSVHFQPEGTGSTTVRVSLKYMPPAGALGAVVAKLLGEEPAMQIKEDLDRFKQMIESETIPYGDQAEQAGGSRSVHSTEQDQRGLREWNEEKREAIVPTSEAAKAAGSGGQG